LSQPRSNLKARLWAWGPVVVYAVAIYIFSSRSHFPLPRSVWRFDKLLHAGEYAGLAVLGLRALRFEGFKRAALWAVLGSSLFGFSDEVHQYFTPGRSSEVFDWVADTVGASIGVAWAMLWSRRTRRNGSAASKP
jgi:VanZ family protein